MKIPVCSIQLNIETIYRLGEKIEIAIYKLKPDCICAYFELTNIKENNNGNRSQEVNKSHEIIKGKTTCQIWTSKIIIGVFRRKFLSFSSDTTNNNASF